VAGALRDVTHRSAVTRLAWAVCLLSIFLAAAALFLAAVNGESLPELIADHHAVGIMDALVLAPIGALIVVGDRRHLSAELPAVVDRTMRPTATSLWLRPSAADPAPASPTARTEGRLAGRTVRWQPPSRRGRRHAGRRARLRPGHGRGRWA
jgi:hypothetical protein